jgi:16S rRNA (uracil1498-N3)-methyltransferase
MAAPRFHVDIPLQADATIHLPAAAVRHAQVLRLQPGVDVTLFDGRGGEWAAQIVQMGRQAVHARVVAHRAVERELTGEITLALGVPANERMDTLIEKATELGATTVQPLQTERSVLRLGGERAERRRAHWQAIAVAACEQCGRNRVPAVAPLRALHDWLATLPAPRPDTARRLLGFAADAQPLAAVAAARRVILLSGPEGGLSADEEAAAQAAGFVSTTLGPRVLRADTAPLAALAWLAIGGCT